MNILLTGSTGQIGTELVNLIEASPHKLYAYDKQKLDITDKALTLDVVTKIKPNIIINAAAYTNVDLAEEKKEIAYAVNTDGPRNLATISHANKIFLIHISTDYVFDGLKTEPYFEDDSTGPINVYGKTKLHGEEVIRSVLKEHIILRTSWVFGKRGKNFVKTILKLAKKQDLLKVIDDQYGCPTSATSIAKAILNICENFSLNKQINYGTYHYSGTPKTSWYKFAKEILAIGYKQKLIGDKVIIQPISSKGFPTKSKKPNYSVLSISKIEQNFNIMPQSWILDLEEMMKNIH